MNDRAKGVTLTKRRRRGRVEYWAKWTDPDSGAPASQRLDTIGQTTKELRADWIADKNAALAKRRGEIASGAQVRRDIAPDKAVADYLGKWSDLRERTRKSYRETLNGFERWAKRTGLRSLWDLDRVRMAHLRDDIVNRSARGPLRGERGENVGRGAKRALGRRRAPATINRDLRQVGPFLQEARRRGFVRLTSDQIRDCLRAEKTTTEKPEPLNPAECRSVVRALLDHDENVRAQPVAPLFALLLLTGMRLGEALALRWEDVDLDGWRINLRGGAVKTRQARAVLLSVSPAAHGILSRLRLKSGDAKFVFGGREPLPRYHVHNAVPRLRERGAPSRFSPQTCRQTCAAVLVNAPSIAQGRNPLVFESRQLGHSVTVAERHYIDLLPPIPADAQTVEDACQIASLLTPLAGQVSAPPVAQTEEQREALASA